ncbi:MAG: hydrogenase [Chloroflexi bacterium]|nr:hydrogenase [Chloroflexota bacterium]
MSVPSDPSLARGAIDAIALLLLATVLASTLVLRVESFVRLLAVQGVLLAAAAGAIALGEGTLHAYAALIVTALVKAVGVPGALAYALRRIGRPRGAEVVLSRKVLFVLAAALTMLAFYVTDSVAGVGRAGTPNALPSAVALVLVGLFTMITRKKALAQVVGLVMMENGIYLAALVVTRGLPLAVELGVAADVLVGVLVMGLVAQQIERTFSTIDTDRLQGLRG